MTRLPNRLLLALVALSVGFAGVGVTAALRSDSGSSGAQATVDRVVDGDTLVVDVGGKSQRIRLVGVDTPETVAPDRPVGCFGKEASDHTKSLLPKGTRVKLVYDVERFDKYQRVLAYVYRQPDDLFVNAALVRDGYANTLTIPPNVAHAKEFARLASDARTHDRGLWAACSQ